MSRFREIVFCVPLLFRRHDCLCKLKHAQSLELPLTARKTVFSHLNQATVGSNIKRTALKLKVANYWRRTRQKCTTKYFLRSSAYKSRSYYNARKLIETGIVCRNGERQDWKQNFEISMC